MSNETLSMKQANRIISESNAIIMTCQRQMEARNNEFVEELAKIWEDQNAVDYINKHKQNFEAIVDALQEDQNKFTRMVEGIANGYAKVGGKSERLQREEIKFKTFFDTSKVKTFFEDGEGDEFGFKDTKNGPIQVMDAFNSLKSDLEKCAQNAINQIKHINAFGNQDVQLNLAQSSGRIVSILSHNIEQAKTQISEYLEKTAQQYVSVGAAAVTGALIGMGAGESGSTSSGSGTVPTTKYAPPTPSGISGTSTGSGSSVAPTTKYAPPTPSGISGTGIGSGSSVAPTMKYAPPTPSGISGTSTGSGSSVAPTTKYAPPTPSGISGTGIGSGSSVAPTTKYAPPTPSGTSRTSTGSGGIKISTTENALPSVISDKVKSFEEEAQKLVKPLF